MGEAAGHVKSQSKRGKGGWDQSIYAANKM